jgi:hypothetical protein
MFEIAQDILCFSWAVQYAGTPRQLDGASTCRKLINGTSVFGKRVALEWEVDLPPLAIPDLYFDLLLATLPRRL